MVSAVAAKVKGVRSTVFVVSQGVAQRSTHDVLGEAGGSLYLATSLPADAQVVTEGRATLSHKEKVVAKESLWDSSARAEVPAGAGGGGLP